MELANRVVLITGASDGIGAACAREFRRRGARLALMARSMGKLLTVAEETSAIAIPGDVTNASDRAHAVETTLARHGRIDILINNAGAGLYEPSHTGSIETVRSMFELNVFAVLAMTQLVAPAMKAQRDGMIINVSSIAGLVPLPWFTMYSATKYGVCAMTDGLRMELASHNVRAMAVCPGYVRTGFQTNVMAGKPPEKLWRNRQFAITPEQCARAIASGVERESHTVVTPRVGWALVWGRRFFPRLIDHFLRKIYQDLEHGVN